MEKNTKKRIAITGGIGSGKSLVCSLLVELGEVCFSCDAISKSLWKNEIYLKGLSTLFPSACVNGVVDKKLLSALVFSDEVALKRLNEYSHPQIMEQLYANMENASASKVFAEVPLLFEGSYEKNFDKIIVVVREKAARIQAVSLRDGCTTSEVEERISVQFDYKTLSQKDEKIIVLNNDNSIDELRRGLLQILNAL